MLFAVLLSCIFLQEAAGYATYSNGTSRDRVCNVVNPSQGPVFPGEHGQPSTPTPNIRFNYTTGGTGDGRYYAITFDPFGILNPDVIGWSFQVRANGDRSFGALPFGSFQKHNDFVSSTQLSECEGDDGTFHTNMISNTNVGDLPPNGYTNVKFIWHEDDGDGPSTIVCPRIIGSFMITQDQAHYEVESDCLFHPDDPTHCQTCSSYADEDSSP